MPKITKDWKKILPTNVYHITEEGGTEIPFTGKYVNNHETGMYECIRCGSPLFTSNTKFESGTGWPSFYDAVSKGNIELKEDKTLGMTRTEVLCKDCGSHLGHLFNDGPPDKTGLRYCINSVSLNFKNDKQKQ